MKVVKVGAIMVGVLITLVGALWYGIPYRPAQLRAKNTDAMLSYLTSKYKSEFEVIQYGNYGNENGGSQISLLAAPKGEGAKKFEVWKTNTDTNFRDNYSCILEFKSSADIRVCEIKYGNRPTYETPWSL